MEMLQNNRVDEIIRTSALRDRRVHIFGVVGDEMALECQHYLQRIYDMDKANGVKDEDKKITILLNTYGGSIWAGNIIVGMINFLQSEGYEITAIVQGFAFSMGFDILVSCDKRYGYSFSEYMLHQSQCGSPYGALVQGERSMQYNKKQWEKAVDLYVSKTNLTRKEIEDMYDRDKDWFMLCEEALEKNVIHKILK